jgi:hypothetical protein
MTFAETAMPRTTTEPTAEGFSGIAAPGERFCDASHSALVVNPLSTNEVIRAPLLAGLYFPTCTCHPRDYSLHAISTIDYY